MCGRARSWNVTLRLFSVFCFQDYRILSCRAARSAYLIHNSNSSKILSFWLRQKRIHYADIHTYACMLDACKCKASAKGSMMPTINQERPGGSGCRDGRHRGFILSPVFCASISGLASNSSITKCLPLYSKMDIHK